MWLVDFELKRGEQRIESNTFAQVHSLLCTVLTSASFVSEKLAALSGVSMSSRWLSVLNLTVNNN